MTKHRYVMWRLNDDWKVKTPDGEVTVKFTPGREAQFFRLIASWQVGDGTLPLDLETDDA